MEKYIDKRIIMKKEVFQRCNVDRDYIRVREQNFCLGKFHEEIIDRYFAFRNVHFNFEPITKIEPNLGMRIGFFQAHEFPLHPEEKTKFEIYCMKDTSSL
jgi:hypothetical protein